MSTTANYRFLTYPGFSDVYLSFYMPVNMPLKTQLLAIALTLPCLALADVKEDVALKYFEYLFYEDIQREQREEGITSNPKVSSFYSSNGHRMIVVAASVSSGKSYFVLMSVNELNMGFLAWKQRGFGISPEQDIARLMEFQGQDFNFEQW